LDVPADVRGIFSANSPINYSSSGCFRFHRESLPPSAKKSNWTLPARGTCAGHKDTGPHRRGAPRPAPSPACSRNQGTFALPYGAVPFDHDRCYVHCATRRAAFHEEPINWICYRVTRLRFRPAFRRADPRSSHTHSRQYVSLSLSLSLSLSRVEERTEESASRGEFVRESSNFRARLPADFLLEKKRERERETADRDAIYRKRTQNAAPSRFRYAMYAMQRASVTHCASRKSLSLSLSGFLFEKGAVRSPLSPLQDRSSFPPPPPPSRTIIGIYFPEFRLSAGR